MRRPVKSRICLYYFQYTAWRLKESTFPYRFVVTRYVFSIVCVCVKVWNLANCKLKTNHIGHTGYLNTVTVSPDGSLCASGGKVRPHHTGFLFQRRAASRTGYDYFIEMYTYVILVYWLKIIKFMIIDFWEKNPQVVVFVRCYSK